MLIATCLFSICADHFPIRRSSQRYGASLGDILLDNIICTGSEASLLDCNHNPLRENNCDHSEEAGVVCGGKLQSSMFSNYTDMYVISF